eukprot:1424270-Rhodomonas_salina.3
MIRLIIAIAVQAGLTLYQEIYLKLPPCYSPTAKLLRSLYGLQQAPSAFHALFEEWLLKYGFKLIGGDRVTFLLTGRCGTSVVLLSIYVNDGISVTNNEALYKEFLADLSKPEDFELSNQGKLD